MFPKSACLARARFVKSRGSDKLQNFHTLLIDPCKLYFHVKCSLILTRSLFRESALAFSRMVQKPLLPKSSYSYVDFSSYWFCTSDQNEDFAKVETSIFAMFSVSEMFNPCFDIHNPPFRLSFSRRRPSIFSLIVHIHLFFENAIRIIPSEFFRKQIQLQCPKVSNKSLWESVCWWAKGPLSHIAT